MSTEHTVNGKLTKVHDEVHFTDTSGKKHKAKITHLDGHRANLEATVDG